MARFAQTCGLICLLFHAQPWLSVASNFYDGAEIISDLGGGVGASVVDENRALEIKAESFWQTVLTAAEDMKMTEHMALYAETKKVIAELPVENEYVRTELSQALKLLQQADELILASAVQSSGLAEGRLAAPAGEAGFSFFSGGQNFLKMALQRFVSGGNFPERLRGHVEQRQADILPVLRGAATSSGNVLANSREASKRSFDVLKYDIYNKGVPKTPQAAKDVAYKLVDAAGETRHRFMQFITRTVSGIGRDFAGRSDDAAVTVMQSSLRSAEARAEAEVPDQILNL